MREKILELLRVRPFVPFRVQLSNGTAHVVKHPEQALVTPGYVIIGVNKSDAPGPDVSDTSFVSLIHIVEATPLTLPTPASAN